MNSGFQRFTHIRIIRQWCDQRHLAGSQRLNPFCNHLPCIDQKTGGNTFIQAMTFQVAGTMRNLYQFFGYLRINTGFLGDNFGFQIGVRIIKIHRSETLFGGLLEIFHQALYEGTSLEEAEFRVQQVIREALGEGAPPEGDRLAFRDSMKEWSGPEENVSLEGEGLLVYERAVKEWFRFSGEYEFTPVNVNFHPDFGPLPNLGVLNGWSIMRGWLTGTPLEQIAPRDKWNDDQQRAETMRLWCEENGVSMLALSLQFCLRETRIHGNPIGSLNIEQLEANVVAAAADVPDDVIAEFAAAGL